MAAAPSIAQEVCQGVGTSCSVEDLGNDRYRMTFVVTNGSSSSNTVFRWGIDPPNIPSSWMTVSFDVPPGWDGAHPDSHLEFQTPNGDLTSERIFSQGAASCGGTSLTFRWTFDRLGGPVPDCGAIDPLEYRFHVQPIDPGSCLNAGRTFVCPGVVPVEPATWGLLKSLYGS